MERTHQEVIQDATKNEILGLDGSDLGPTMQYPIWLNTALAELWPVLEPNISAQIGLALSEAIQGNEDADHTFIGLSKFCLGPRPPILRYISIITQATASSLFERPYNISRRAAWHLEHMNKTDSKFIYAEIGVDFRSDDSKIVVDLGKTPRRGVNWWMGSDKKKKMANLRIPSSANLVISKIVLQMKMIIAVELTKSLEVDHIFVSFTTMPRVRFSLKPLGAFDLSKLPVLGQGLQYALERLMLKFTDPSFFELNVITKDERKTQEELLKNIIALSSPESGSD